MGINFKETKTRIRATGRTVRGYARSRGFNPFSFEQFLKGDWKGTKTTADYIAALAEDGFLVESTEGGKHAA